MGGSGKTQTVAKFVQIHKEEYDNIYWIAASNLQNSLTMIIKQLLDSKEEQLVEQGNLSVLESAQRIIQLTKGTKVLYVVNNIFEDDLNNVDKFMTFGPLIHFKKTLKTNNDLPFQTMTYHFSNFTIHFEL